MTRAQQAVVLGALGLSPALSGAAPAQQSRTDGLQKEVRAPRKMLQRMQKDIQEIKANTAMHDRFFENQNALEPWSPRAEAVGLDVAAFGRRTTGGKHAAEIRHDMAGANRLRISETPEFLLGRNDPKSSRVRLLAFLSGTRPAVNPGH
jgi:hypothetical protein